MKHLTSLSLTVDPEQLRAIVREEVAAALGSDSATEYRSDGPLPPRTSRKTFNIKAPGIPGARKVQGRGKGFWVVGRAEWHAAQRRVPVAPVSETNVVVKTDVERADEMIAEAGCRRTR